MPSARLDASGIVLPYYSTARKEDQRIEPLALNNATYGQKDRGKEMSICNTALWTQQQHDGEAPEDVRMFRFHYS